MAPQELTLPGVAQRNRKAALTMSALFVLAVCLIFLCARWYLQDSRKHMLNEMGQEMNSQASGKVALLTVWSGTLAGQVNVFVSQDLLRLFAAEVSASGVPAQELLQQSQESNNDFADNIMPPGENGVGNQSGLKKLAPRLPLMVNFLKEFAEKNNFTGVCLVNIDLQIYLAPEGQQQVPEELKPYLMGVVENKQPVLMPVRRENGRLVMDVAFPIFAPLYVDSTGDRVVSLLLATYSVLPVITATTGESSSSQYNTHILQVVDDGLQRIAPTEATGVVELPGWTLSNEMLPLGTRIDPGLPHSAQDAYGLALPVPNLPWLVEQTLPVSRIDERFAEIRQNVMMASAIMIVLAGVVLAALWWSLVSRNERAVAEQMHRLYLVVNQQKQIMDGVNSALSAGIVLNDLNGVIHYANQSFARMCGLAATELRGRRHSELGMELAHSLVSHTLAVHRSGEAFSFAEALLVDGKLHYFLTSCTPFRDENGRLSGMVSVYSDMTEIALTQQRSQQMVAQTVNAFVRAIEAVDTYLRGQSAFTAQLAVALACGLGRNDAETLATLRTAANLSHVGMIRLPKDLLTKTGTLSDEERALLRNHVEFAREALADIDFGLPVLEAITQMYERLDGSGYPAGLSDGAICQHARILAVANTFCALVRPRSYREAHGTSDALKILGETPPKYDAAIVNALRNYLDTEPGKAFMAQLLADQQSNSA